MDTIKATLAQAPLFAGLPEEQIEAVCKIVVREKFSKGDTVFTDGDTGRGFYIVETGSVKVYKLSLEGKEQIFHIFGPGEPFGEVPVFTGKPFPANAMTIKNSTLLFLPRKDVIDLISQDPSLALNMLAVLSSRLRQFTVQIESLSLKEVPGRLAAHLIWLAQDQEDPSRVTLEISKGQLASLLGTIPETLSRILAKMVARELIEVRGKDILILDHDGLKDLAESGKLEM
jgi:CRP/FNR family transcriptional regulator